MKSTVYTIGHSNHGLERFLELLRNAKITAVADVRSMPYSRFAPHFNQGKLGPALTNARIEYVFLGDLLGARPLDSSCYRAGKVDFDLVSESKSFQAGLTRVLDGAKKFRVALMCAEKEPLDCHRNILVARRLQERGARIRHVLADGDVEDNEITEARLLTKTGLQQGDLFAAADEDPLELAYQQRSREIAYGDDDSNSAVEEKP